MSHPQFIPSGLPHAVEMSDGSSVAKSKSRKLGDDVRRTEAEASDAEHIVADHVVLQARELALGKSPRADGFERASDAAARLSGPIYTEVAQASLARPSGKTIYDTAMADMDFPARFIQLRIDNDKVRDQLQVLESRLRENS